MSHQDPNLFFTLSQVAPRLPPPTIPNFSNTHLTNGDPNFTRFLTYSSARGFYTPSTYRSEKQRISVRSAVLTESMRVSCVPLLSHRNESELEPFRVFAHRSSFWKDLRFAGACDAALKYLQNAVCIPAVKSLPVFPNDFDPKRPLVNKDAHIRPSVNIIQRFA